MSRRGLFVSIAGVAGALLVAAYSPAAEAPEKVTKTPSQTVVDETGNVLFGTGTPGRVRVTNFLGLGPANPSDIVTVSTYYENACPGSPPDNLSRVFNRLEGSDGTHHSFTIPAGKVLVITSADIVATPAVANHRLRVWLSKNTVNDANIVIADLVSDSIGSARLHFESPTGTVAKSGVNVCLSGRDITAGAPIFHVGGILFGYLTDDL